MPEPNAKRQKTMPPTSKVIDAAKDDQADLHLKAGPAGFGIIIRAHSTLLKMASPVFKAMLGPAFVEGATSYTEEAPLLLPDDDPRSLTLLCAILHHQCDAPDNFTQLAGLTVLADKYQCIRSVKPFVSSLLGPMCGSDALQRQSWIGGQWISLEDVLSVAYIVHDQRMFWWASKRVVALSDIKVLDKTIDKKLWNVIPARLLEDLYGRQVAQRKEMVEQAKQLIPEYFLRCSFRPWGKDAELVAAFQYHLWKWEMGEETCPWLPDTSLENTWTNMERLAGLMQGVPTSVSWMPVDKLRSIVAESKKQLVGLCLECQRKGAIKEIRKDCGHPFRN